ncbi:MAG: hypothetical protein RL632_1462 [Bacteroidota bacterium]
MYSRRFGWRIVENRLLFGRQDQFMIDNKVKLVVLTFSNLRTNFFPRKIVKRNFEHFHLIRATILLQGFTTINFDCLLATWRKWFLYLLIFTMGLVFKKIRSKNTILGTRMRENANTDVAHKGKQHKGNNRYAGYGMHDAKVGQ